jgi:hypothetical protein
VGIGQSGIASEDVNDADWLRTMDVNVNGVFWCSRSFGKHMIERKRGTIVNLGSMFGNICNRPQPQTPCNVSKAAVHHMTKSMAAEWAAHGASVNAVDGHDLTGMEQSARRHLPEDSLEDEVGVIRLSNKLKQTVMSCLRVPASTASKASSPNTETVSIQSYRGWPAITIPSRACAGMPAARSVCEEMPATGDGVIGNDSSSPTSMSLILTLHHATTMSVCPKSLPLNSSGMR